MADTNPAHPDPGTGFDVLRRKATPLIALTGEEQPAPTLAGLARQLSNAATTALDTSCGACDGAAHDATIAAAYVADAAQHQDAERALLLRLASAHLHHIDELVSLYQHATA